VGETARPPEGADPGGEEGELKETLLRLKAMYFLSVEDGRWADLARDTLSWLRSRVEPGTEAAATVEAYRGAFQVVRAKHASWPPNKLKHLRRGSEILDVLVAENPANLEIRYLRLASYLFLPSFLKREEAVAADTRALELNLPDRPDAFSPAMYRGVVQFLLENGDLTPEDRTRLQATLVETSDRQ
jgi:hypothetical protein